VEDTGSCQICNGEADKVCRPGLFDTNFGHTRPDLRMFEKPLQTRTSSGSWPAAINQSAVATAFQLADFSAFSAPSQI